MGATTWPSRSSMRVERIRAEIVWEGNNQTSLKARAKTQDEEVLRVGLGDDAECVKARSDYVLTLYRIRASKKRIKTLELLLSSTIDNAKNPKLWDHEEDIPARISTDKRAFDTLAGGDDAPADETE